MLTSSAHIFMARIKKRKSVKKDRGFRQKIHWGESYTSFILGIIVVVLFSLFGILFAKHTPRQEVSSTFTENLPTPKPTPVAQITYTVKPGDNLWSISEKVYKSGYNWIDIAKANNLENPGLIFSETVLKIPDSKPIMLTGQIQENQITSNNKAITGDTYTIEKGDTVWDISVRAYGDGFRYVEIIKANNLENPSLIFSGNILKIPRQT